MATRTTSQAWTTRTLIAWMREAFEKKGLDSPRLMAELLLCHVAGCERMSLYTDADRPASPLERDRLRDLVGRALRHEPVQYLVGEAWFYGLPFHVTPAVLVPRPCTETLVEQVLLHARAEPGFGGKHGDGVRFADVCTGSGCIAVTLLKQLPAASGIATDISEPALEVARKNAARHKVADRLEVLRGDLCAPLIDHPAGAVQDLHYVVANPPYIPDAEWATQVDRNVKDHEPEGALRGGPDGLKFVRPLIAAAPALLRPRGLLAVEVAAATARDAAGLMREHPQLDASAVRIVKDLEGLERVVIGVRRAD